VRATVLVRPKPGILDPQGQAVATALRHLGFDVGETRVGRLIDVELDTGESEAALAEIERMCDELLANPLIESYEIKLEDAGASRGAASAPVSGPGVAAPSG